MFGNSGLFPLLLMLSSCVFTVDISLALMLVKFCVTDCCLLKSLLDLHLSFVMNVDYIWTTTSKGTRWGDELPIQTLLSISTHTFSFSFNLLALLFRAGEKKQQITYCYLRREFWRYIGYTRMYIFDCVCYSSSNPYDRVVPLTKHT